MLFKFKKPLLHFPTAGSYTSSTNLPADCSGNNLYNGHPVDIIIQPADSSPLLCPRSNVISPPSSSGSEMDLDDFEFNEEELEEVLNCLRDNECAT